ncbi:MAG TPA: zinc-dependent alcohol dehydrogenase family protein [Burkholderiaceae bacterium]|nr:zinc-dependent alcohol dehydrogenase family protein [Burkholderiaceae bacterium]
MRAMVLEQPGAALVERERPEPSPQGGEVRLRVLACAVCRTDLHVVDGDLPWRGPVVPGHEIVGVVEAPGSGVRWPAVGQRVGVPWLGGTCGHCAFCRRDKENLCDTPQFTGYTRDGGFATHVLANAAFCVELPAAGAGALDDVHLAPLLCAGLIGWRSLKAAGDDVRDLGLYGFGAAAHLIAQVAVRRGMRVHAFTRRGDSAAQQLARRLGACWAGASDERPPAELDAAILFAPAGELVPRALAAVRKGGRVVCGGIHMSDIPSFPYERLWGERTITSVANLTRHDAREFMNAVAGMPLDVTATPYPLARANQALADLREGRLVGAAVLVP